MVIGVAAAVAVIFSIIRSSSRTLDSHLQVGDIASLDLLLVQKRPQLFVAEPIWRFLGGIRVWLIYIYIYRVCSAGLGFASRWKLYYSLRCSGLLALLLIREPYYYCYSREGLYIHTVLILQIF